MIPNLLVHDHILVKKYSLGIKVPFSDHWIVRWRRPQAGEIVVFKFPENPDIFYIKRLIGLPGDEVSIKGNGQIFVNGKEWTLKSIPNEFDKLDDTFKYFIENSGRETHTVRFYDLPNSIDTHQLVKVPPGHYFFMGDNRDQSSDG
jgi:signal peptidase I